jgi:hypothetical protein
MLTNRQKYDYRDVDRYELKLIKVGHALWAILRREKRQIRVPLCEIQALVESIETIVRLKRQYRSELKVKLADRNAKVRERFAGNAKEGISRECL